MAGKVAIENGRRGDAKAYLARLRPADPGAAIEMEMAFADFEGDFSRVVQIGRDPRNRQVINDTEASGRLAETLNELGYSREALMVDVASPFRRSLQLRKLPDIATIMARTQATIGTAQEHPLIWTIILELARTNRHSNIASLYDRPGFINRLKRIEPLNRAGRAGLSGIVGEALRRTGRERRQRNYSGARMKRATSHCLTGTCPPKRSSIWPSMKRSCIAGNEPCSCLNVP